MVKIMQRKVTSVEISLSNDEAKEVVTEYLKTMVIGKGCYVTEDGRLEHWTSYPHGSGTTTDMGEATALQKAADKFLAAMEEDNQ